MAKARNSLKRTDILKIVLLSSLTIIIGLVFMDLQQVQYGYMWYALLMTIGVFFILIALLGLIPLVIIWKQEPKKRRKGTTPIAPWLLRVSQHTAVAIGSVLIYITSFSLPFTSEAAPYMYLYCVVSIIATIFGNRYYIQYYREHRMRNPHIEDLVFKLGISVVILGIMVAGIYTSAYTMKDIPHLSNPKQITLQDVTLKYASGEFFRISVYKVRGYDESGKKRTFKIGSKAVKELGALQFDALSFTYLPNTNIIIEFE